MLNKFTSEKEGNIAVTSALLLLPIMLAIGSAVDYTAYSREQSQLKNAVDAAVLAVGRFALQEPLQELEGDAKEFLKANISPEHYAKLTNIRLQFQDDQEKLRLITDSRYDTSFMRIAGIQQLDYEIASTVNLSGGVFEVALVLDSTGSMAADGKMAALKTAAGGFIDDLTVFNSITPRVRMGVVPFSDYVNVGVGNRNASWIDVPPDTSEYICQMVTPIISSSGCSDQTFYNDGAPYTAQVCTSHVYGPPEEQCNTVTKTWNGCVGSRPNPLNIEDRSYATRVPGLLNIWCGTPLTELTTNDTQLKSAINALNPNRNTYIASGLTWGLRVLSPQAPFAGGGSYTDEDLTKVVVLMSDGENVSSISPGDSSRHNGSDVNAANQVTLAICDEMKDVDIIVYTIGFGPSIPAATKQMLADCSTDGANYYDAADATQLAAAFDTIAAHITALFLSE